MSSQTGGVPLRRLTTILCPSYLHNGISFTSKTSLCWLINRQDDILILNQGTDLYFMIGVLYTISCYNVLWRDSSSRFSVMKIQSYQIHYSDIITSAMASQITGVSIVYSTVCLGADQRKRQNSASLAFLRGIHRWSVNSPHKRPVTRKMFPSDDVIIYLKEIIYMYTVTSLRPVFCRCNIYCILIKIYPSHGQKIPPNQ